MDEGPFEYPAFDPPPRDQRLANWLEGYPESLFDERLYKSIELMERYSIDLAIELLRQLDVVNQLTEWRSASEVCHALSFQSHFAVAAAWLLERLIETGCIEAQTNGQNRSYRLVRRPWRSQLANLRAIGIDIDPANAATLDLLDRAAGLYRAVALGEKSAESVLFGQEGIPLWLNYFHNHNPTYAVNNWVGAVIAADSLKGRSKFRILEVGAGAGSGSEILLQCLDQRGLLPRLERYRITDSNAFFRRYGQRHLSKQYPDLPLEWAALDLDLPWQSQGTDAGEFHLIFGVNVLHVAKDLLFSLAQARDSLAADGSFVIGECVRPYPNQPIYVELIFQILDSFTAVKTDSEIRPNAGFLTPEQWYQAFTRAGFEQTQIAPDIKRIREVYPHFFAGAVSGRRNGTGNDE